MVKIKTKAIKKPKSQVSKLRSKYKTKAEVAKVKSKISDLKHKQQLQKLDRQRITNELKAHKKASRPKEVTKRANREFELKRLEAKREVDVINAKNKWKNTLAAGVTSTSTIDSLKNDDGKSIQKEIENALAGPTKPSLPVESDKK